MRLRLRAARPDLEPREIFTAATSVAPSVLDGGSGRLDPGDAADIVILEDHINLMPDNPLRGINDDRLGPRFPDMSEPWNRNLIEKARRIALELGISAHKGVLVAVPGPNLETRAEYRILRMMGADIVGMSTVPECITAVHAGLKTVGFSIVTDMCLPDALEPANIDSIVRVATEGGKRLEQLPAAWTKDKTKKSKDEGIERATILFAERSGIEKKSNQRKETAKQSASRQRLEAALLMPVRIGDKVKIVGGGRQQGEVLEVRRDKYMVRLGGVLSTWVERKQFVHWEVDL